MCNQFSNLINTLKKEEKSETGEKYPWLDKMDERKNMSDREILEKYIDLSNTCLHKEEKEEVMDMLYKYKEKVIFQSYFLEMFKGVNVDLFSITKHLENY